MEKVIKKDRIIKVLSIIQWIVGILTLIGYILSFTERVNEIKIMFPYLFVIIVGIKKVQKKQLVVLCKSTLSDLKIQRDNGSIDNKDYQTKSQKIANILYTRKHK